MKCRVCEVKGETFLLINNNNSQSAFTICVLYFLNLPPDKSYGTGVGSLYADGLLISS